jgi:hypothetical protein
MRRKVDTLLLMLFGILKSSFEISEIAVTTATTPRIARFLII